MQKNVEIIPTMTVYNTFKKYEEVMQLFFEENVTTIRVNMTRFEPTRYITEISLIRKAYKKINPSSDIKILLDVPLPGKKPRVCFDGIESKKYIHNRETFYLTSKKNEMDVDNNVFVVEDDNFIAHLNINKNGYLYFDDGNLKGQILGINNGRVKILSQNDGAISFYKSVYTDGYYFSKASKDLYKKYLDAINAINPEYLALSFVEYASDIMEITSHLKCSTKIISKIETPQGVSNLEDIIKASSAIMIGRGDLAITCGITFFGEIHAKLLKYSNDIDIYVATDILQSLVENNFPNRAELIDVANLISSDVRGLVTSGKIAEGSGLKRFRSIVNEIEGEHQ